jgi:hypothetical protein
MASLSRVLRNVTARDALLKNGELFAAAGSEVIKMLKVRMIDPVGDEEIEIDTGEVDKCDAAPSSTPGNSFNTNETFCRRGISGSSKSFDVEDRIEDDDDDLPEQDQSQLMDEALAEMIQRAVKRGLPAESLNDVEILVQDFRDVFRLELGRDPPANVEPLKIELIDEDLDERKLTRARRFPPLEQDFLNKHLADWGRLPLRCACGCANCPGSEEER